MLFAGWRQQYLFLASIRKNNSTVRKVYGADRIRYPRCRWCGTEFSERRGAALFGSQIREARAGSILEHVEEGCRLGTKSGLVKVHPQTVRRLVCERSGRPG